MIEIPPTHLQERIGTDQGAVLGGGPEVVSHGDTIEPGQPDFSGQGVPQETSQGMPSGEQTGAPRGARLRASFTEAVLSVKGAAGNVAANAAEVWQRVPDSLKTVIVEAGRGALLGAIGSSPAERSRKLATLTANPRAALFMTGKDALQGALQGGVLGAKAASTERGIHPKHVDTGVRLGGMAFAAMQQRRARRPRTA
jgi:hypothetical protein